ncbi:MAG TPA: DUF4249 domain-containing protein [Fulvivirga sp.]|nr:DUF4249 domain-containing protein [Fulvivirga sp.]
MIKRIFIFLVLGLGISCVDPISIENNSEVQVLVVEGGITTEYGPHKIKLSNSAKYGDIFAGVIQPVLSAKLLIRDEFGNVVQLVNAGKGYYETPETFKGEVGRTYTLVIIKSNGDEYMSYPETIHKVAKIDSIYYKYKELPIGAGANEAEIVSGVDIMVRVSDPGEEKNYYKWESSGTYRIKTNPELYTPPRSRNPQPKDCCEICYINENNIMLSVASDILFNSNIHQQNVLFLEDDGARFSEKYVLILEQISLTKEAYNFYDLLKNQIGIDGDIFDPPAAKIRGNILSISNPNEEIVGYFTASDVQRDTLQINGENLPKVKPQKTIPDDCRVLKNSTAVRPVFW